jgi:hypothetical protein
VGAGGIDSLLLGVLSFLHRVVSVRVIGLDTTP